VKLLFVRHATTDQNDLGMDGIIGHDDHLNAKGIEQANNAATICLEHKPSAVYSSPLNRAKETADIIANRMGVEIVIDDRLREYEVGARSNMTIREAQTELLKDLQYVNDKDEFNRKPNDGSESWNEITNRVSSVLDGIIARHSDDETIAIVTHNVALKVLLGIAQNLPFEQRLPIMSQTGSVSAFSYEDGKYNPLFLNKV